MIDDKISVPLSGKDPDCWNVNITKEKTNSRLLLTKKEVETKKKG